MSRGLGDVYKRQLSEPDEVKKASYIALISLTKSILEQCIDLLAIECPDRM